MAEDRALLTHDPLTAQLDKATAQLRQIYQIIGILEKAKRNLGPCVGLLRKWTPRSSMYSEKIESLYKEIKKVQDSLSKDFLLQGEKK